MKTVRNLELNTLHESNEYTLLFAGFGFSMTSLNKQLILPCLNPFIYKKPTHQRFFSVRSPQTSCHSISRLVAFSQSLLFQEFRVFDPFNILHIHSKIPQDHIQSYTVLIDTNHYLFKSGFANTASSVSVFWKRTSLLIGFLQWVFYRNMQKMGLMREQK